MDDCSGDPDLGGCGSNTRSHRGRGGLLDGLSQVTGNLACYARLPGPQKKICIRAWWGHADATKEWYDTSEQWRNVLFAGQ